MFQRLKKKFSKQPSVIHGREVEASSSTQGVSAPRPEHVEAHGLSLVADGAAASAGAEQYPVDIIAIHGLNGDASQTWTHENETMWIRDLLPDFLPGCRVYTYGYPAKIFFNKTISGVQEYSRGLLGAVRDIYEDVSGTIFPCLA